MKPFFKVSIQPDGALEMLVYEEIGEDYWSGGGVTAKTVKDQLDGAGVYSRISLRINSPGGDAFEGVAIGNLLKSTGKPIDVYIDGIAASAASIIAMCGDTITMGHNTMMMIHNAWSIEMGDNRAMAKMAERLSKIDAAIAQTYVNRTGKSMDDVRAMMDEETWMSAEECVEMGFATALALDPDEEKEANALAMAKQFPMVAKFRKRPRILRAESDTADRDGCLCDCQNCMDDNCSECTNDTCDDPNCKDCPMQLAEVNRSNLSLFQALQWETEHGIRAV
jgi:ATP-dependent protease ClpP protease subunit